MSNPLNTEQTQEIKNAVEAGAKLADIQKIISEKFGISMTYMDVRFLVDDLNIEWKEEETPAEEKPTGEKQDASGEEPGPGGLQVEIDPVQRPGAVAGGKVVFSDGVNATWELDYEGRLRLGGAPEAYQPSPEDIQGFQQKLHSLLGGQGI
jgi:hypothetical protein